MRFFEVLALVWLIQGCATLAGIGLNSQSIETAFKNAKAMDNPVHTGYVKSIRNHAGPMTYQIQSYNDEKKLLCVVYDTTDNVDMDFKLELYPATDITRPSLSSAVFRKRDAGESFYTSQYETIEKVEHRSSSGKILGYSERPHTKTRQVKVYAYEVCFSNFKLPKDDQDYYLLFRKNSKGGLINPVWNVAWLLQKPL